MSIAFNYEGWKTEEISNVAYRGFARNLWEPLLTAVSFINVPRLLIRLTHYGLWFTPPHLLCIRGEKAPRLPALVGSRAREARAATAFTGGKLGTPNEPRREP